jgi:hypothetical protein
MSALQCECLAVRLAIDCLDVGDWAKAAVWLRLADEASEVVE